MRRIVLGVVAGACSLLASQLSGCYGNSSGPLHHAEKGGGAGENSGGTRSGSGGSGGSGGSDGGGQAGAPSVGGGGTGRGGNTGDGGTSGNGATAGDSGAPQGGAGDVGGDGGIGGDSGEPDQLTICLRLQRAGQLAFNVTLAYEGRLVADCRVNWTTTLYNDPSIGLNERDVFLNNLLVWNLRLWGCNPTVPTDFALIYHPAPLTSADAQALIDDYVQTASNLLAMSPPEIAEMRALLARLSQPVITEVSDEYSNSRCTGGGGGAAGGP